MPEETSNLHPAIVGIVLAFLPVIFSWLIAIVPSRRREASGLIIGNPLLSAPLALAQPPLTKPLLALSRELTNADTTGYVLGMRHMPVEKTAALLARCVRSTDPALQLYAQSTLAEGRERLQSKFARYQRSDPSDARCAAWALQAGMQLASPTLTGNTERPGLLSALSTLATQRLESCEHTPALLTAVAEVYLLAGKPDLAARVVSELPEGATLRLALDPAIRHAQHQQQFA
jgi:hypothetical protein